jgi:hypothetical protein
VFNSVFPKTVNELTVRVPGDDAALAAPTINPSSSPNHALLKILLIIILLQ